jgi:hypothetical protein
VIEHNIGRDISKFFYGSYMLETNVRQHLHSNIARKIANEIIIGRLRDNVAPYTMVVSAQQVVN